MMKIKYFINTKIINLCYFLFVTFTKTPQVLNELETIELMKKGQSICRFGDGEFNIMQAKYGVGYQDMDQKLAERLTAVLHSYNEKVCICIPDMFLLHKPNYLTVESERFWKKYSITNMKFLHSIPLKKYGNASTTRPYVRISDIELSNKIFEKFREVWLGKDLVIIEGAKTRLGIGNDLFDSANSIKRIICPSVNAFFKYDEILKSCDKIKENSLVLIALGPTATILAYDLSMKGFQAIDIGHIDIEYEWYLMQDKNRPNIIGKYTNESKSNFKDREMDDQYYSQIIAEIN